jgi:hypothetical protein
VARNSSEQFLNVGVLNRNMYKFKWFVLIFSKNWNVCSFENNKKKYENIFKIGLKIYFGKNRNGRERSKILWSSRLVLVLTFVFVNRGISKCQTMPIKIRVKTTACLITVSFFNARYNKIKLTRKKH